MGKGFFGKHSEESKRKMSLAKIGKPTWNKGTHGKMNIWNKGIKIDKEKYPNIGHTQKHTEETKKKMSEKAKGRKFSEERNKKISEAMKKRIIKPETIEKLRDRCGKKNPNWKEEKADRTYHQSWTELLRKEIRKRDKYVCQECGLHQDELYGWNKQLDVHHIDYNKFNCNKNNLITLCRDCHNKTNHNRQYWIKYYTNL